MNNEKTFTVIYVFFTKKKACQIVYGWGTCGISNSFCWLLRKKIAGAVKICEQDPLHLIRTEKGIQYIYIYNILKQFNPPYILLSYIHFFPGRNCEYGGEEEYYVTTRETGALEQNRLKKDERKEITKDLRSLNWLDPQLHDCRFIPT